MEVLKFSKSYLAGQSYSLEALGECSRFGGYRYLFEYFVSKPKSSYMDSYFGWLYPQKTEDTKTSKIVLLSLIDPRIEDDDIARWQQVKLRYLSEFKVQAVKQLEHLQVYILTPKS